MDPSPLVNDQVEAGARFLAEFQKYVPVKAAFWLKDSDEREWYLYVASDQITDDNFDVAYGEVGRIAGELRDPLFDVFQVKVLGADDPLAKAASEINGRYARPVATRFHDKMFGGLAVEEGFIYPSPM